MKPDFKPSPDMSLAFFYLIRHGETESNLGLRFQGQGDGVLSALGRQQAQALAAHSPHLQQLDCLYASDLGRAMETAAYLANAQELPIVQDQRLRERNFGVAEGLTWDEVVAHYPEAPGRWTDAHYTVPEGETRHEFRQRFLGFFEAKAREHAGQKVAVVTHGGVLNFFLRNVLGYALDIPRGFAIRNTSVNIFSHSPAKGWRLETWGDVIHLHKTGLLEHSPG